MLADTKIMQEIAIVVIGRNEGERLLRCLESVKDHVRRTVYVDSGSTDGSLALTKRMGVECVELDMATPFTAGRARNAGFERANQLWPDLKYIQFIDGDCQLCSGWIDYACEKFAQHPSWAVVAGHTIERYPEKSIYNQLCDLEWKTPIGEVLACGGIFMVRQHAFHATNGFNPALIAGEEPELCYRLRKLDWEIHKLDMPMVLHDAAITRFSQWWRRSVRSGHSYAQGFALHGNSKEKFYFRDLLRIWLWGLIIPGGILCLAILLSPWLLLLFLVYLVQFLKIVLTSHKRFKNWRHSLLYAFFNILGKWPQLIGQLVFLNKKMLRKVPSLIEYK